MPVDESRNLADKLFFISDAILRWNSKNMAGCYNVNGKRPDSLTKTQRLFITIISALENATVSDIEEITGISKSSISITVSRMVEEGLLVRYKGNDGRKLYLKTTEKAVTALNSIREYMSEKFQRHYNSLNEKQKEYLKLSVENGYLFISDREDSKNES